MSKNTNTADVVNISSTAANEGAFYELFNKSPEGKALAEKKAQAEQRRLEKVAKRYDRIERNVQFDEGLFGLSLPNLAELIEKLFETADEFRVGKFFLISHQELLQQSKKSSLSNEQYIVSFAGFDKDKKNFKVIVSDSTEGGPIDQAVSKKKTADAAVAMAKAAEARAAEVAAKKKVEGQGRVEKLKSYMALIGQEAEISPETAEFLMSNIPNCSREFKASREEVLSYAGTLDSRSFPDKIPEEGSFAILAPVTRDDERRDMLFIYIPELDARKALSFQLRKFLSEEQVSSLMENLVGDKNSWYAKPWVRRGSENFLKYAEGVAKALRLKDGQIAYDMLQGVVKVSQPGGRGESTYIVANPSEASCFAVERRDGKVVLNLYLPK